jgi:hypothetical protein
LEEEEGLGDGKARAAKVDYVVYGGGNEHLNAR